MVDNDFMIKLVKQIEDSNRKAIEEANRKQTSDIKEHINREIAQLSQKFEEKLKKQNEEYEKKYIELKTEYEKLAKETRKNNIIIFGLDNHTEGLTSFVLETLSTKLEINFTIKDIDNIYKIGKQTERKPIKIKLVSYLKKQEILKNCRKLKGSNISVAEDLSPEERKENQILRQHLKKARENHLNASIKNKKLLINGQHYTAQELESQDTDSEKEDVFLSDEDIIEVRRRSNSDPSMPTTLIEGKKKKQLETVPERGEASVVQEVKNNTVTESLSKLRSSVRVNSTDRKKTGIT